MNRRAFIAALFAPYLKRFLPKPKLEPWYMFNATRGTGWARNLFNPASDLAAQYRTRVLAEFSWQRKLITIVNPNGTRREITVNDIAPRRVAA